MVGTEDVALAAVREQYLRMGRIGFDGLPNPVNVAIDLLRCMPVLIGPENGDDFRNGHEMINLFTQIGEQVPGASRKPNFVVIPQNTVLR